MASTKISKEEIVRCQQAILAGKVLAYPTETVWGLGADLKATKAVEEIFDLKGRAQTKAVSLLVRDITMAREYAEFDQRIEKLMEIYWPGPLTFVLPAKSSVPSIIHGGSGFVGLRCSSHIFVRELMSGLPNPVTTTSANRAGELPALQYDDLSWLPSTTVKAAWSAPKIHDSLKGSTVVRFHQNTLEVLREGDLPSEWLKKSAKQFSII